VALAPSELKRLKGVEREKPHRTGFAVADLDNKKIFESSSCENFFRGGKIVTTFGAPVADSIFVNGHILTVDD
jgi:hypothetical protein